MTLTSSTITTELLQHADGRPVAYVDATSIAVFICQQHDGTYVIDICTRDDRGHRLRLLLDGEPLPALAHRPGLSHGQLGFLLKGASHRDQSLAS